MWLIRHRFWQSGHLFTVCSLILAAGFLLQIRVLYHNHLKHQRLYEYKQLMRELSEKMGKVEQMANTTSSLLNRLEHTVNKSIRKTPVKIS